ncbi:MAG: ABC transporter permease [Promethearchaeota archaeon]
MAKKKTNMVKYILKRMLMMIPMLLLVLTFTWILSHMMIVSQISEISVLAGSPEEMEAQLKRIGYKEPWYIELGIYFKNFFIGDWGVALTGDREGTQVFTLISEIFPKTIELMIIPIVLSPIIAVKLGLASAKHRDKLRDIFIRIIAILGAGFPIFWIATLLQIFFGLYLGQFTLGSLDLPVFGTNNPDYAFPYSPIPDGAFSTHFRIIDSFIYNDQLYLWDTFIHLIIPALCVTFVSLAGITRQTRSSMLDVLDQDYIRTARAKGVLEKDVINQHALRNALLPTSNLIIGGTAAALLGSFYVEVTFNYKGFGFYMWNSIFQGDYMVINGLLVFATIIILSGNLVADVMYTIIDPRIVYR